MYDFLLSLADSDDEEVSVAPKEKRVGGRRFSTAGDSR